MATEVDYMGAFLSWFRSQMSMTRIYVGGLPKGTITEKNPASAIAVLTAGSPGGFGEADNLPVINQRIDVICYATTRGQAHVLHRQAAQTLRNLTRTVVNISGTDIILHNATKSGGAFQLVDDDTNLPIEVSSYILKAEV